MQPTLATYTEQVIDSTVNGALYKPVEDVVLVYIYVRLVSYRILLRITSAQYHTHGKPSFNWRLTLKWPRYLLLPLEFHGPPPEKTPFPPEFCNEICTIYVQAIKKLQFWKKKCCSVSKWRPNNRFLFRVISILAKFLKTLSQRNFSMKFGWKEENMNRFFISEITF